MKGRCYLGCLLGLAAALGCSEKSVTVPQGPASALKYASMEGQSQNSAYFSSARSTGGAGGLGALPESPATDNSQGAGAKTDKKPDVTRKIIQTATVFLIVENFDDGEKQLRQLIAQHGGHVSNSDTQGTSGTQRSGTWKIRIPVEKFDAFKQAVEKIGNLERSSVDTREVTEEYYDIQARLKNKTVEEARLINHLEKTTGKLADILEVERELSRVRGEIEQLQGRLNLLENLTSLTTIEVHLREVKNYTPPTAPTFGEELSRTLDYSATSLVQTGKNLSLTLASILPWLPVWIILGLILYRPLRWGWRQMKTPAKTSEAS